MKLSIVIATYNRAESLVRCLDSVSKQSADSALWECVVVNNNSSDDTPVRFEEFKKAHPNQKFTMVDCPEQGLSHARNCGIDVSSGDYVAFVDDDETLVEDYVASVLDFFSRDAAFVAGGPVYPVYEGEKPSWLSGFPEKMVVNPIQLPPNKKTFPRKMIPAGGNMIFNREVFTIYGKFDTSLGRNGEQLLGGEETEMFGRIRNLGERLYYIPKAGIYHHISKDKLSLEYFDRLSYGVGVSKILRCTSRSQKRRVLAREKAKNRKTYLLAGLYLLSGSFKKMKMTLRMRRQILKGVKDACNSKS